MTLVQPPTVHDLEGVRRFHDGVADLARRYPGRFYGIACPNPHLPGTQYEDEATRCVEELGFVGLKLHPFGHATNPLGTHGLRVFEVGEKLGVPVMVHTGAGIPWAAPSLLRPIADKHPGLKIVVAHAGANILSLEATLLAESCPNVYLEPSWVGGHSIRAWVREHRRGSRDARLRPRRERRDRARQVSQHRPHRRRTLLGPRRHGCFSFRDRLIGRKGIAKSRKQRRRDFWLSTFGFSR